MTNPLQRAQAIQIRQDAYDHRAARDLRLLSAARYSPRQYIRMKRRLWRKHGVYFGPVITNIGIPAKEWRRIERALLVQS